MWKTGLNCDPTVVYNRPVKLQVLGTAAAEGWPAPFCECEACQEARRRGGANLRSRSGALLDDDFKIDFSADTLCQMQRARRSLAQLRTLVFTHQHSDHVVPGELQWMWKPFTQTPFSQPLAIYGNAQVLGMLHPMLGSRDDVELFKLKPFRAATTPTGDTILPLPAQHVEGALVLRISRGDKHLFYGHDSGFYPPETLEALSDGTPLDIALFDCTNGGAFCDNKTHMGIDGVAHMARELRQRGAVTEKTRLIATHFSHNGGLLHEELVRACLPHGIEVAFDGMVLEV